jgi:hypothetical protein
MWHIGVLAPADNSKQAAAGSMSVAQLALHCRKLRMVASRRLGGGMRDASSRMGISAMRHIVVLPSADNSKQARATWGMSSLTP